MAEIREKEEIYLPQEIIHHIQSFLNTKESAQTTLLSKSWLAAWSTRPVLIFDEGDFPETIPNIPHPLPIFCKKTLNRYKLLDLKADKFVLRMNKRHSSLADKFIISALILGVNEIVLRFDKLPGFVPFPISLYSHGFVLPIRFNLPARVFASTTLTRLSVDCSNCMINVEVAVNRVLCSRLTSLILRNVCTKDDVMRDILLGCPLIENLDLDCHGLQNINVSKLLNLVEFRVGRGRGVRVEFMDGRKVTEFHYLRKLDFSIVTLSDDFFTKFPFMFPCIEDFTLKQSVGCQAINISSDSLRHLSLSTANRLEKVQLNVPNITKFKFQAYYEESLGDHDFPGNHFKPLPSLSFDNVSRDWECDVQSQFDAIDVIDAWLFEDLRKFLIQLTNSRISLCVAFAGGNIMLHEKIPYFHPLPAVENLTVCDLGLYRSESILLGLSRICCSKVITICKGDCCFCI